MLSFLFSNKNVVLKLDFRTRKKNLKIYYLYIISILFIYHFQNQRLSASDAVPEKVGVAHYHPSRPGLPDSFVLSASIGSFRPAEERDSRRSAFFTRWLMRHNGRILVTLFVGAVERVSSQLYFPMLYC